MSDLLFVTMAGLPGAGKSSIAELLAREFGVCLLELDRIEAPLLERGISGDTLGWGGYKILSSLAEDHLSLGHSVILDCVCWTRDLRVQWAELAHTYRASFRPIEVVCSDEALHRSRLSSDGGRPEGYATSIGSGSNRLARCTNPGISPACSSTLPVRCRICLPKR